jgi:signal transduction histidine kinase
VEAQPVSAATDEPTTPVRAALRRHLDALVRATEAVHTAPDRASIGRAMVRGAVELLGARAGIWGEYNGTAIVFRDRLRDGAWEDPGYEIAAGSDSVTARIISERRGALYNGPSDQPVRTDLLAARGIRNFIIVPLLGSDGTMHGTLSVQNKVDGVFDDDDLAILQSLAAISVTAFDNEAARRRAARGEARERFLARASAVLGESLDLPITLARVVDVIVPELADWCTIAIADEHGTVRRVAAKHVDPQRGPLIAKYLEGFEPAAHREPQIVDAVSAGRSSFYPRIADEFLERAAQNAEHLELLRGLGCTSVIIAPLIVRGQSIGALSLMIADHARAYDDADHQLGRELAGRIALAVDHARRFAAERAAARAKDEFLAILGHELRNPLAPILTALELMGSGPTHAREREVIARQTRHLVRLVDDLLDVSRIARGKVELHRERLELATVTREALDSVALALEQRAHRVTVDVPLGLVVDADPTRLAQIIVNLLTNAAKYTDPGGTIAIRAERTGDRIRYRVIDSGIGIATDMLPRIFDMFAQADQPLARQQGGLGLGLTIARSLMHAHGGTITARSDGPGQGSELILELPAAAPAIAKPPQRAVTVPPRSAGQRVLVVDDNEDAAELMAASLTRWGYTVEVAHDASQALAVVGELAPSAAVLDIGLPVMDGYELARRLREMPAHAGMILIAVTGYGQASDRARALDAGFDRHLVKPVSAARIREILEGAENPGV